MAPEVLALLLRTVEDTWRELPPQERPSGVWVCLHDPLHEEADEPRTPVRRVWFLSESGAGERDPWEYQRFYTVHFVRPWASVAVANASFTLRRYAVGLASIAEYAPSGDLYVGWQWAGLHGRGVRLRSERGALRHVRDLWVS